jgi:hypothetical protein
MIRRKILGILSIIMVSTTGLSAFTDVLSLQKKPKLSDTPLYFSIERFNGFDNEETLFGQQKVDVFVGNSKAYTYMYNLGEEVEEEGIWRGNIGISILSSKDKFNEKGFGFNFKIRSEKSLLRFHPYIGGFGVLSYMDGDGREIHMDYKETKIGYITKIDDTKKLKKGNYKAYIVGGLSAFRLGFDIGTEFRITDNISLFGSYNSLSSIFDLDYHIQGVSGNTHTNVTQGSSGLKLAVQVKF